MTETSNPRELTHNAYGLKRETRVSGRYREIGDGRLEVDAAKLPENLRHLVPYLPELFRHIRAHVYLDRTILGSFSGHVYVVPISEREPVFKPPPQRPAQGSEQASEEQVEI